VVPKDNAQEASAVDNIAVYPARSLGEVVGLLNEQKTIKPLAAKNVDGQLAGATADIDFSEIRRQEAAKQALTVAAAGEHNLLMIGPAGTGKTMMAKALPGILPPLSREEALEVTRIYSSIGQVPRGQALLTRRPVRTPHHTPQGFQSSVAAPCRALARRVWRITGCYS